MTILALNIIRSVTTELEMSGNLLLRLSSSFNF